jgi:hypothetical protein
MVRLDYSGWWLRGFLKSYHTLPSRISRKSPLWFGNDWVTAYGTIEISTADQECDESGVSYIAICACLLSALYYAVSGTIAKLIVNMTAVPTVEFT